jgi:hypothetical protein
MTEKSERKVKKEEYDVVLQGQPAVKPMVVSQREGEPFRVWSPNEFSLLKRVLIGRPEGTNMPAPEWAGGTMFLVASYPVICLFPKRWWMQPTSR